jgi:hypothetical protein
MLLDHWNNIRGPMVVCPPGIRFFLEKGQGFSLIDLGGFHYAVRFGDTVGMETVKAPP